ncbi:adhesin [Mycoplasma sp. 1654_15]|uniref:adhesin n=1 Tax=Mycoplasma sp. 1654_15 TaxID=2725994 RepID=UPI0014495555|nr:adhesin [Mycoplasma sp. 1654_15]QJB71444.1 adhesin [Mycoplasma sp. 1654_15]
MSFFLFPYEDLDRTSAKSVGSLTSDDIHTYANAQSTSAQNSDPLFIDSPDRFVLEKSYGRFNGDGRFMYSLEIYDPNKLIQNVPFDNNPGGGQWARYELYDNGPRTANSILFQMRAKDSILNFRKLTYISNSQEFNRVDSNQTISKENAQDIPNYTNNLDSNSQISFKYKYEFSGFTKLKQGQHYQRNETSNYQGNQKGPEKRRLNTYISQIANSNNPDYKTVNIQVSKGISINASDKDKLLSKIISANFDTFTIKSKPVLYAKNSPKFINTFQTPFIIESTNWWFGTANNQLVSQAPSQLKQDTNVLGLSNNIDTDQSNNTKFGIEELKYNKDNNTVEVKYHRDSNSRIQTIFPEVAYASFVNQKGDLYFFGGKDGQPLSYVNDFDYTNNSMTFYLTSEQIPYNQRPKYGEILSFVGVVVIPYLGQDQNTASYQLNPGNSKGRVRINAASGFDNFNTIDFRVMYLTNFVKSKPIYQPIKIGFNNWI